MEKNKETNNSEGNVKYLEEKYNFVVKQNKQLRKDLAQLLSKEKQYYLQDFLTDLFSKNYLVNNMENWALQMINGLKENKKLKNDNKTWSVIFCDIDGLKLANSMLGPVEADQGIKHIASIINRSVRTNNNTIDDDHRKESNGENDEIIYEKAESDNIPIRFGGDEFLIILPNCTKEKAIIVVNRIREQINLELDKTRNMSLSFGVADTKEIPMSSISRRRDFINSLISLAAHRMATAKHKDLNRLSLDERNFVILKVIDRAVSQLGLSLNNTDDLDMIGESFAYIKETYKKNRK